MQKKPEGLQDLFVEGIEDLLDTEKQLVRAIPAMAKAASDEQLASALRAHLEVTKGHVERLEHVFGAVDKKPKSRPCKGIRGIVEEGKEAIGREKGQPVMDTAIAGSARKVEHYEIASYETVCAIARQLGLNDVARLLMQTLDEEIQADRELARISQRLAGEVQQTTEEERPEMAGRL
jgi:ferritin-like metal-binding protein YciE